MDLRQLEYLVAVADHGGFTRAAAAVHAAQPTLSHGIRTLEVELGVELFARLGRRVAPTAAGELVIEAARRVLADMVDLRSAAAAVTTLATGRLDVVALPTLAVDPLAALIGRFRVAHPGIVVHVHEPEDTADIVRQVSSGQAELGLTDITVGGGGLVRVPLGRQEVVAVCPPGAPGGDTIAPAELLAMPLVATPPGTSTRRLLDLLVERSGRTARLAVEIAHREAILPLVLAGAGTALLPASMAADARARGAVVRSVRPALTRRIGLLHRRGRLTPAAAAMVALATHRRT